MIITAINWILFWNFSCHVDPTEIPNAQMNEELNSYPILPMLDQFIVEEMADAHVPGLAACIVRGDEIIWCNGYGYADIESEVTVSHNTPFMLASISKTFVAIAAMHLQENGNFSINDPINSMLDFNVTHPDDTTPITTKMLLSHTAGIKDNWSVIDPVVVDGDSPIALGEFLKEYLTADGEYYNNRRNFIGDGVIQKTVYSNIGAALAAYVIEVESGIPFNTYCKQYIFEPLQMVDTAWHISDLDQSIVALPYEWSFGGWESYGHYGYPDYPSGQLRSGAEQLATFLMMFGNDGTANGTQILSADSVTEMSVAHYPDLDSQQGLVWYWWEITNQRFIGHNGGDYGSSTEMGVRDDGLGFVILMNSEGSNNTLMNIEEALLNAASDIPQIMCVTVCQCTTYFQYGSDFVDEFPQERAVPKIQIGWKHLRLNYSHL